MRRSLISGPTEALYSVNQVLLHQRVKAFGMDVRENNSMAQNIKGGPFSSTVEGYLSDTGLLCSGMPHRSLFGPLPLLICVSDVTYGLDVRVLC